MSEIEKLEEELRECLTTTSNYYSCSNFIFLEFFWISYSVYMIFFTKHTDIWGIPGSYVLGLWIVGALVWLYLFVRSIRNIWKFKTKCSHNEVDQIIEKLVRTK